MYLEFWEGTTVRKYDIQQSNFHNWGKQYISMIHKPKEAWPTIYMKEFHIPKSENSAWGHRKDWTVPESRSSVVFYLALYSF